jgi:hypothetical protein
MELSPDRRRTWSLIELIVAMLTKKHLEGVQAVSNLLTRDEARSPLRMGVNADYSHRVVADGVGVSNSVAIWAPEVEAFTDSQSRIPVS